MTSTLTEKTEGNESSYFCASSSSPSSEGFSWNNKGADSFCFLSSACEAFFGFIGLGFFEK